jgi:phosphoglycolate phosphatase
VTLPRRPAGPPYDTVIFDLDGTLVDSRPGILAGIRFMLAKLGHELPADADLDWMIGPPIEQAMARLLAPFGDDRVALAVATYREHYSTIGLYDVEPYEGIPALLDELSAEGRTLLVGTSKLAPFARRVLDHLGFMPRFAAIHGAEPDGRFRQKADLLRHVVAEHRLDPSRTVMVGDREHDVLAARACGLDVVGVTFGYGNADELHRAGATVLCDSVAGLRELV